MSKTLLIIKREYLSRVRKKTFILATILTPLLFAGLIAAVMFLTVKNIRHEKVAVVDPSGVLKNGLQNGDIVSYELRNDVDTGNFEKSGYSAILLPPGTNDNPSADFKIITSGSLSRFAHKQIRQDISNTIENNMISDELKVDPMRIDSIRSAAQSVGIDPVKKSEIGKSVNNNFELASGIGYFTAFLIYITLIIYGVMVMRGVMEEKTNRIAEVMISSVKPFQLMLGKIIGIGAVGLTQFLIWIILVIVLLGVTMAIIPPDVLDQVRNARESMPGSTEETSQAMSALANAQLTLSAVNWPVVIGGFVFYFLGGYLFYASLFAAVGSTVNEDAQDAQSLSFPITMPIILSLIIMINSINDPTSTLATWASIIPFTSPIVMMSRIPFGVPDTVPYWQLAVSMLVLVAGFLFTTWLSAKIYRTGILLYGKKPSWKEMMKWLAR